jgi:hypothetical protein
MGTELPTILEPDGRPHKMSDKEIEIWTQLLKSYPPTVRAGAGGTAISSVSFGIFVVSNKDVSDAFARQTLGSDTPQGALLNAFNAVGLNAGVGPANNQLTDSKLRIIVGSKP